MRTLLIENHLVPLIQGILVTAPMIVVMALLGYFFLGRFLSPLSRAKGRRLIATYLILFPLMAWGNYNLNKVMYDERPPSLWRAIAPVLNAAILFLSAYIRVYLQYNQARDEPPPQSKREMNDHHAQE